MREYAMHTRVEVFVAAAAAALAGVAQPAAAQPAAASPAAPAEASVSVPREVLERYVGRYELNGAILAVGLTGDGRLTAELSGQPPGPPLRTVSANEFANDAVGVRVFFEGEGPKATRIRSRYNGGEVVGTRIADAPGASPSAVALGDSSAVVAGRAWLETNKMTDDAAFEEALRNLWPTAPGAPEQWIAARALFRTLELKAASEIGAGNAELLLFDPDLERYLLATVTVRPEDPGKLAGIRIAPTDRVPEGVTPLSALSTSELVAAVRTRAEDRAAQGRFDGAVLVARNGQVLFQQAYGFADAAARQPNTVETQFRFGSMGKMFTAVAIMQLIEAGKIDPSAPIGQYLPGYANRAIAEKVTVAHLLSHTGGTGDIFGPEFLEHRSELRDPADYVALFQDRAPQFEVGTRAAYSNYGFMLMGRIVETVSGSRYDDYVARHIWDPAGMGSTGNQPESLALPLRAVGYMGPPGQLARADDTLPYRGTPAGGGYSTVGDFSRFAAAIVEGTLLKPETLDILVHGGVKLPDGTLVPYDFGGTIPGKGRWIGHGGAAPGMSGLLMHFLDSGFTVVALANRDSPASDAIVNFAAHRLPVN